MVYDPPHLRPCPICGSPYCNGFHWAQTPVQSFQPAPLSEEDMRRIIREELYNGKWILMSERKPLHNQRVIYWFEPVGMHMGRYDTHTDTFFGSAGFLCRDVTHWMPAPEKP
jgi:Protein of unknown function (DUF551)